MRSFAMLLAVIFLALTGPALPAQGAKVEQAIAALKKLGGRITTDDARPGHPVIAVSFAYRPVTDGDLAPLKDLPTLESLDLRVTRIGEKAAAHLKTLTAL